MTEASCLSIDELLRQLSSSNAAVWSQQLAEGSDEVRKAIRASSHWKLVRSSDGEISVVENRGAPHDYSSNDAFFALHTDGLHHKVPPQFSLLYCENPGTKSVPTVFLDTTRLLERLRKRAPDAHEVLQRLDQVFIGRDGRECRRPIIEVNPVDGAEVMNITFGRAYFRPARHVDGTGDEPHQAEAVAAFQCVLQLTDEIGLSNHVWNSGDLVAWDNYRFIHGRGKAVGSTGRRLIRAWLSPKVAGTKIDLRL
jgi:alpha-ketoglutarate-dependent taurine dioxygenase